MEKGVRMISQISYVHGDSSRLFINTHVGCSASCSYCYLPLLGYEIGQSPKNNIKVSSILELVFSNENFLQGQQGTILSIGCYSECWDRNYIKLTTQLIIELLKRGNPVQLSTKKRISLKEMKEISRYIQWKGQLSFFISCASISRWEEFEAGTIPPQERFMTFYDAAKIEIPSYLYIKPVIEGITISDIDSFAQVMKQYNICSVIGKRFSSIKSERDAPIAKKILYYCQDNFEDDYIYKSLNEYGKVYRTSIAPILEYINTQNYMGGDLFANGN